MFWNIKKIDFLFVLVFRCLTAWLIRDLSKFIFLVLFSNFLLQHSKHIKRNENKVCSAQLQGLRAFKSCFRRVCQISDTYERKTLFSWPFCYLFRSRSDNQHFQPQCIWRLTFSQVLKKCTPSYADHINTTPCPLTHQPSRNKRKSSLTTILIFLILTIPKSHRRILYNVNQTRAQWSLNSVGFLTGCGCWCNIRLLTLNDVSTTTLDPTLFGWCLNNIINSVLFRCRIFLQNSF